MLMVLKTVVKSIKIICGDLYEQPSGKTRSKYNNLLFWVWKFQEFYFWGFAKKTFTFLGY